MKLNMFLQPAFKDEMLGLLENTAITMSQIADEAYQLANLHVTRIISGNGLIPKLDQSFFRSCISLVCVGGRGEPGSPELRATAETFYSLRPAGNGYTPANLSNLTGIIDTLAKQMETMANNNIVQNAFNRIVAYAWSRYGLKDKDEAEFFVKSCFLPGWTDAHLVADQISFKLWIEKDPYFDGVVKDNLNHFIRKLYDVLQYFEEQHQLERELSAEAKAARVQQDQDAQRKRPRLRLFTLLPHKGDHIPGFFEVNKSTLPTLLGMLDLSVQVHIAQAMLNAAVVPNEPFPLTADDRNFIVKRMGSRKAVFGSRDFQQNPALTGKLWNTLFQCHEFDTVTRKFNYVFSTDGYAVSLNLQKPKAEGDEQAADEDENSPSSSEYDSPENLNQDDFNCFVGVDPGRTYVATAFAGNEVQAASGNVRSEYVQISTREIRHDSKMNENKKWQAKFRENNPAYAQAVNAKQTLKTANYVRLQANIRANFVAAAPIINMSRRKVFRARRFKSYRFGQKAMTKAIKKLIGSNTDPSRTVIGWGDWEQQDGGFLRGNDKAPVKKFRRACRARGIKVIKINEHLTSKRCSGCCSANHKCANFEYYQGIKCHQVIRCTNSECEEVWQRDLNGARNIHNVLMSILNREARPNYLS